MNPTIGSPIIMTCRCTLCAEKVNVNDAVVLNDALLEPLCWDCFIAYVDYGKQPGELTTFNGSPLEVQ